MPAHNINITGNLVAIALRNYNSVESYRVTLRSRGKHFSEEIRYYYKSGFIRMEFIRPFCGTVLTYNPLVKEVRLKPLQFVDHVITLSPESLVIRSSAGHRVDQSDIGSLLCAVAKLQAEGRICVAGDDVLAGRETILFRVVGNNDVNVCGIHRYDLWLEKKFFLPVKVVSYDLSEELLEEVVMDDLEINIDLPDDLFRL